MLRYTCTSKMITHKRNCVWNVINLGLIQTVTFTSNINHDIIYKKVSVMNDYDY